MKLHQHHLPIIIMIIYILHTIIVATLGQSNCTPRITGCIKCNTPNNNICVNCTYTYFAHNGVCERCSTGCNRCQSQLNCTSCKQGYYIDNQKCLECPANCSSCIANICDQCFSGSYLNVSDCVSCLQQFPSCASCNSSECETCLTSYSMKNGKCSPMGGISQVQIIIIASVSSTIVVLILLACGIAYYFKSKRRVVVHQIVTRSMIGLQLDGSTQQATEVNFQR